MGAVTDGQRPCGSAPREWLTTCEEIVGAEDLHSSASDRHCRTKVPLALWTMLHDW